LTGSELGQLRARDIGENVAIMIDKNHHALGEVGHDGGGVAGQAEKFFSLGAHRLQGGSRGQVAGHRGKDIPSVEGGGRLARKEEVPVFDQAGLREALAGQNLGQQTVIGSHVNPACGRADGQGGPV